MAQAGASGWAEGQGITVAENWHPEADQGPVAQCPSGSVAHTRGLVRDRAIVIDRSWDVPHTAADRVVR